MTLSQTEVEQTKLLANALDRASTACITIGILTPLAGFIYDIASFKALPVTKIALYLAYWLIGAIALHYGARRILRKLS